MSDLFWAVVRLAISLPLVAALAYFAVRYGLGRRLAPTKGRHMRVIEQLPVGPRAALTLVQVGRRYYLLAHQEGRVTLLQEFDHLPEELPFPGMPALDKPWPVSFRQELAAAIDRLKERAGRGQPEESARGLLRFLDKHRNHQDGRKDDS